MRPMGLLVILFDRELRCEFFQQITMGTPSHGGAGQQSMSARTGRLASSVRTISIAFVPFRLIELL
jgi:hypothetical protein